MPDDALKTMAAARLGRVLRGKYRLDRVLGIGGMATVYAATHRNSKQFAIKVLHAEISMAETTRARFLREGYLANQVKHPGAVAVLDEDVAEDGSAFLVMELLEGQSLDDIWNDGARRLPLELVVSVGDALLDVLAAAHTRGIVHRDLKPANLFLTSDGALKVLDFGIARLRDDTATHTTVPGSVLGTPAFMAPEQLVGRSADVDAQTDLWAVGATLFSLLAGTLVHEGENALQFIADAATRPARSLGSVAKEVPRPIADVIDRALRTDKGARWTSAPEMREALASAWRDATGGAVAPLPKRPASVSVSPASTSIGMPVSGGGRSDPEAFVPTMDASGGSARSVPMFTTGAAVAKGRSEQPSRLAKRALYGRVALAALGFAIAAAGVAAYRASHAPRSRYCAFLDQTIDGPRCALEIDAGAVAARGDIVTHRVTEVGGRVVGVEDVTFGGPNFIVPWADDLAMRTEVVRGDDGRVRSVIARDQHGNDERREVWSEGGKRVDLVESDGVTPRRLLHYAWGDPKTSITTIRREFDAQGRVSKEQYFAVTGRPAADLEEAYGYEYVFGRTPGTTVRTTVLGADGKPAANKHGVSVSDISDDGVPGGADVRYFDLEGAPVALDGVHHEHRIWTKEHALSVTVALGLHDEPVTNLDSGVHESRSAWDPVKHAQTRTFVDEAGHAHPAKHRLGWAERNVYDERGHVIRNETLDGQGNPTYRTKLSATDRFSWDDHDNLVLIERLDIGGAPMQAYGWAKQEVVPDARGRTAELREYDESGHLAPSLASGAITRFTVDARGMGEVIAELDANGRPFATADGSSTTRVRYDRLRSRVEVTLFGPDGQSCIVDEGFAVVRCTYDDDGGRLSLAYLDAAGAPTMYGGEYATERLTRDALGRAASEEYLDAHGERVLRKAGYAALRFVRDRNGDVIEESAFGRRDEPVVREGGYATKKTSYDVRRRPVEVALFDVSGAPTTGAEGWALEHDTYDDRGLLVRQDHLDVGRKPVLTKAGSASLSTTYDGRGNVVELTTLGIDARPVATADGFAMKKQAYDERDQLTSESLFGADGKPAAGKEGWSVRRLRYDDHGSLVEEAFFDGEHRPVAPKGAAYASITSRFDKRLRLVETSYFDVAGTPSKGPDGAAAVRYERDANGHAVETAYVDGLGVPIASNDGKIVVHMRYDDVGRVIEELYGDAAGAPHAAKDGCAGRRTRYDRLGRKVEETCVDAKDGLALSADGWATRRTLRDARGNAVDESTYAPDGSLHADKDGVARRKNRFDERNLLQETTFFDAADKPAHDKRGAQTIRFAYDDSGKKTGETAVDERGVAIKATAK